MFNCTSKYLESDYSKPMPWIGLYIAAASLCCVILILTDLINARRRNQIWIPSRYFALNASTLTVLAVAIKFSVDLNTTMPQRTDQLAKLSTSVLIYVVVAHFIPSLGKMGDAEMIANLIALVILIITSVVNLYIQLNTGVIYAFKRFHNLYLASMIYLLMICCCTAIALASIKNELRVMVYSKKLAAMDVFKSENGATMSNKPLKEYLVKFSVMSHTGSPHFVLGRSILCCTSTYICTIDTVFFYILLFDYYTHESLPRVLRFAPGTFCDDESDYEWSTSLVFAAQLLATLVGLTVLIRKLYFLPRPETSKIDSGFKNLKKLERYWIQFLVEIRRRPFFFYIRHRACRNYVHHAKEIFFTILIATQIAVVFTIKILGYSYDVVIRYPSWALQKYVRRLVNPSNLRGHTTSLSMTNPGELRQYVLHLEGEEEIVESMLRVTLDATSKYIEKGEREKPVYLFDFLKTRGSISFQRVILFDNNRVPHLDLKEPPPNCWSLLLITITSLAVLLPDINPREVKSLLKAVREGLVIVKKIEENLNEDIPFINKRKAADSVWEELDIHGKRLDIDLKALASIGNDPVDILEFLANAAKENFERFNPSKESTLDWPIEVVASYSLYIVSRTILLDCQFQTTMDFFRMLSSTICDILGACLTNLKNSILKECSQSTLENMNETARLALNLFGRTEKIMELLDLREVPHLDADKLAFFDEWPTALL